MKRLLAAALFLCLLCTAAFADTLVTNGDVSLDTGSLPYCTEDESAPSPIACGPLSSPI